MLCVANAEGYFVDLNPRWQQTLGWSVEELKAKPFIEFVHPDDVQSTIDESARLQTPGTTTVSFENRYVCKDGSYRWLQWSARVVDGFFFAVARDITMLKEAHAKLERRTAQLERANEDLDQFTYVASHDLKAPLRGIRTLVEMVTEDFDSDPEGARKMLAQIDERAERLSTMVQQLLSYARVDAGTPEPVTLNLHTFVASVIELLALPPSFKVETNGSAASMTCDEGLLSHVLSNLINNAVSHHHRGEGRIVISHDLDGDQVSWTVTDDGPGIDKRHHERIFGMFKTLKRKDDGGGSGIGLAVVRKVVRRMGGDVWVESEPGEGTTIGFTWPIDAAR